MRLLVLVVLLVSVMSDSFAADHKFSLSFFSKVEKLYAKGKYEKVLQELAILDKERFGEYKQEVKPLRSDVRYYHYTLSALFFSGKLKGLSETVAFYSRIHTLDSAKIYINQSQYLTIKNKVVAASESALANDNILTARRYVDALARWGDTTSLYLQVYPKNEAALFGLKREIIWEYLKNYDYSEVDAYARSVRKQKNIADQAYVLTKKYTYDFEKVRAIYSWITHNIIYDYSFKIYDGETTFRAGTGVCSGYSYLFKEMCRQAGIKSFRITGFTTYSNMGHAWNTVLVQGQEFLLDPTWGAGAETKRDYYYLISENELAKTHKATKKE
jgi:hypothetical protein